MRSTFYVSEDQAQDSTAARIIALAAIGPAYKITSVIANRGRGGWTFCYKEDVKKAERIKNLTCPHNLRHILTCDICGFYDKCAAEGQAILEAI